MKDEFKIEVLGWLTGDAGDAEVRATNAEIAILVNSECATEIEDRRALSVRKTIRASAYILAYWLASNWWRLRWEPDNQAVSMGPESLDWQMTHQLASSGGGYVWPSVKIAGDGNQMLVSCQSRGNEGDESISPVRYLNSFEERISASSFELGVGAFVELVLARLDAIRVRKTALHDLWSDIRAERKKKPMEIKRKLEAMLGVDPDEQNKVIEGLLKKWQPRVGRLALEEIAAASGSPSIESVLESSDKFAQSVNTFSTIANYAEIKSSLADKGPLGECVPWRLGKEAAYAIRDVWGLGRGPVNNVAISERLGLEEAVLSETHSSAPLAIGVRGSRDDQLKLLLKSSNRNSRRFEAARLFGDHLVIDTQDAWKPATHSLTARQKFQRAFAAEFLCPSEELRDRYGQGALNVDDLDDRSYEISREYEVSQQLVFQHFENRNVFYGTQQWGGYSQVRSYSGSY